MTVSWRDRYERMSKSTERHDNGCAVIAARLLEAGLIVSREVGIRGGRLDVATLDTSGNITAIYEVKTANPGSGVRQLTDYRDLTGVLDLTLVVEPRSVTGSLERRCAANGVTLLAVRFRRVSRKRLRGLRRMPFMHSESVDRIIELNQRWAREKKAAA